MPKEQPAPPRCAPDIRAEMARRGLTQEALASSLGEKQWWISKRLTGHIPLRVTDLERIAEAMGMKAVELMARSAS